MGRVVDAGGMLERRSFDVVICDCHSENSDASGQRLLEALRREQLLGYAKLFIMVTGDVTWQ